MSRRDAPASFVKLSRLERDLLVDAAKVRGIKLTTFIRDAAVNLASDLLLSKKNPRLAGQIRSAIRMAERAKERQIKIDSLFLQALGTGDESQKAVTRLLRLLK